MKKYIVICILLSGVLCSCQQEKKITSIEVTPMSVRLESGESQDIRIRYSPTDAEIPVVTWSSSNENIVTCIPNGTRCRVTGKTLGSTVVTCTELSSGKKLSSSCAVTVLSAAHLKQEEISITIGDTITLDNYVIGASETVLWSTSNDNICTIFKDIQGTKLAAINSGECTLMASLVPEGIDFSCKLIVAPAKPTKIVCVEELQLIEGEEQIIEYSFIPEHTTAEVYMTSSNPNVVEVIEGTRIRAKQKGTAVLTLATDNGVFTSIQASVVDVSKIVKATISFPGSVIINGQITGQGNICATLTNNSNIEISIIQYTIYANNGASILASKSKENDGFTATIGGSSEKSFSVQISCYNTYMPSCSFVYTYQGVSYVASASYSIF